jgi:drug/metabolite transporter, DME family
LTKTPNANAGVVYVLLATLGWSLSGLFVRLMPELDGWQINCWRGFWMAVGLLVYLILTHRSQIFVHFDEIPFPAVMLSAVCFAAGTTFYVSSLTLASTATVSVIGATSPLITALLSPWITGEKPHILAWVSAVLALLGMGVIARDGLELGHVAGIALSLCVPITFALQTLLLRKYRHHDMMFPICVGGFFAFLFAIIGSQVIGHHSVFEISAKSFYLLMLMGPVQLSIPLVFYGMGAKQMQAVSLSLIAMLDAVINPLWPWLVVGEKPSTASFIGGSIVLGAVLLTVLGSKVMAARHA